MRHIQMEIKMKYPSDYHGSVIGVGSRVSFVHGNSSLRHKIVGILPDNRVVLEGDRSSLFSSSLILISESADNYRAAGDVVFYGDYACEYVVSQVFPNNLLELKGKHDSTKDLPHLVHNRLVVKELSLYVRDRLGQYIGVGSKIRYRREDSYIAQDYSVGDVTLGRLRTTGGLYISPADVEVVPSEVKDFDVGAYVRINSMRSDYRTERKVLQHVPHTNLYVLSDGADGVLSHLIDASILLSPQQIRSFEPKDYFALIRDEDDVEARWYTREGLLEAIAGLRQIEDDLHPCMDDFPYKSFYIVKGERIESKPKTTVVRYEL